MSDSNPFAFNAEFLKKCNELRLFKLLAGAVNPDAAKPEGMCRKHEVAHHEAAVIDRITPVLFGEHQEDDRRAVEGIEALCPSADFSIRLDQACAKRGIGNRHGKRRLTPLSVCRIEARLQYRLDVLPLREFGLKLPYAAALQHGFDYFVHIDSSLRGLRAAFFFGLHASGKSRKYAVQG